MQHVAMWVQNNYISFVTYYQNTLPHRVCWYGKKVSIYILVYFAKGNASYSPECITTELYCVTASLVDPPIFYPTTHVVCQSRSKRATTS